MFRDEKLKIDIPVVSLRLLNPKFQVNSYVEPLVSVSFVILMI